MCCETFSRREIQKVTCQIEIDVLSDTKLQKNNRGSKGPRPGEFPTFGQNSNAKDGLNFLRRGRGNQNTRFDNDLDFNSQLKISNAFKSDMLNRARSRQLG
eukprot:TRINITY_DN8437_c0_g1_i6.p5 TRINITY_DN8437_c0_g1~~TRINITY_DN8437_c0_g1_i6.p5  ORF type:complete len:101 (-),score=10.39 TRINITY_DN8437_c0_g1_i6:734-1036(-)